jgi:DNA modification methylase
MCGDCTKAEDIATLMSGVKATMMVTDPPWNVAIGTDSNPRHRQRKGLTNDSMTSEAFAEFLRGFVTVCKPWISGDIYCVLGASEWPALDAAMRACGYHWSATVIWVKDIFVLGRSKYHRRYEPLWYGWADGTTSSFQGERDLDDVWEIPRPKVSEEHPTMKPVELYERAIKNSSPLKGLVVDPFSGSGTCLLAAERTSRSARCMDIAPEYVAVALERMSEMGMQPSLQEKRT